MSEKVDKFAIFSKKFAMLDDEGQSRLVKAAHELIKTHRGIKNTFTSPLFDEGINAQGAHGFDTETEIIY
jgi:hypothetical protein